MGILSRYTGFLMHDFWSSYFSFDQCVHLICNSHLLRELEFSSKEEKQQWAKKIKELLEICYIEKDLHNGNLPYKLIVKFEKRYDSILKAANKECPEKIGSRKRIAQTKSRCLLERMINYKDSILMFLYHEDFPFTNNQAERDFRMIKVQQKISGQFKSIQGAKWFCRIRSFISTCRKRDENIKDALLNIFNSA
jgi:transposase